MNMENIASIFAKHKDVKLAYLFGTVTSKSPTCVQITVILRAKPEESCLEILRYRSE